MAGFNETEYQALVEDIFRRFPSVQKDGFSAGAYKPGLERMEAFDQVLGYPSRQFKSIHVAGTNGKGSVSNMLASALSACGLRAGLFTSPHLLDFRERMVVATAEGNASEVAKKRADATSEALSSSVLIPKEYVFDFLTRWLPWITENQLSFFEITTGMAFRWFADEGVDVAVIETGLGIFKADVPALVGERIPETAPVFEAKARGFCPLFFADEMSPTLWGRKDEIVRAMDLQASVQVKNLRTVLSALEILRPAFPSLSDEGIVEGIVHTARNMGFHGRWERLQERPTVIADIGHNAHALRHNFAQLQARVDSGENDALIIVYGIMADKDLDAILPLMPRRATYLFATASTPRALSSADILKRFLTSENNAFPDANNRADASGNASSSDVIPPRAFDTVKEAVEKALELATPDTLIYIGGSTFVVADALPLFA